jgi:Calpain family cysteine protease
MMLPHRCRDPNELWVPFIEKAYAKLHGCYKSLIGGSVHAGIGDLTGATTNTVKHCQILALQLYTTCVFVRM